MTFKLLVMFVFRQCRLCFRFLIFKKTMGGGIKVWFWKAHWIIMMLDERTPELFWCIFLIIVLLNAVVTHASKYLYIRYRCLKGTCIWRSSCIWNFEHVWCPNHVDKSVEIDNLVTYLYSVHAAFTYHLWRCIQINIWLHWPSLLISSPKEASLYGNWWALFNIYFLCTYLLHSIQIWWRWIL